MSHKEQELQKEIIRQIKDSRWSVKGYFRDLFNHLIPSELLQNERMTVIDELITDTLPEVLSKQYNDGYVLIFYAHKTYTNLISPFNGDKNASHTSLLLCKVDDGKINQVLNIDGYHSLNYMDIIGERPGATANPHIKNRLVIDAPDDRNSPEKPLQSASWNNLNCPLYAFSFAKVLLNAFEANPDIFDDLFRDNIISQPALTNLKHTLLQGLEGIYVKQTNGSYYRDPKAAMTFHANVRETLAQTVQARFDQQQLETKITKQETENKPSVSVSSSSLFKPAINDATKACEKLLEHCIVYQTHLDDELQKLTGKTPAEIVNLLKKHVINETEPDDIDKIIKKYRIVNNMADALINPEETDAMKRINQMNEILTPDNKAILAEHRSVGGRFLQAVLNILSAIASVFSKQELKYKTQGDELLDNVAAVTA